MYTKMHVHNFYVSAMNINACHLNTTYLSTMSNRCIKNKQKKTWSYSYTFKCQLCINSYKHLCINLYTFYKCLYVTDRSYGFLMLYLCTMNKENNTNICKCVHECMISKTEVYKHMHICK